MTHDARRTTSESPDTVPTLTLSPIGTEALDDPATDPALVARMLRDIATANWWLGGVAAVRFGLGQLLQPSDRGRTLTLFDVGTGAGDLPLDARRWARRRGVSIVPLGLERIAAAAQLARSAGVPVIVGCASGLPLRDRGVDIVLISQVAHHLGESSAVRLFSAASAIARRGVIVADLRPAWYAAGGFRLAGLVLGFHPVTLADGVTSVRRGFAREALRELCVRAGADNVRVVARPGARLVAWWRTDQN
jgi:SAM-dependent methyltransferase